MPTLVAKVARDLRRRPLRNLLTLLGIVLGVAGVVAISVTARTTVEAQRLTYAGSRQADIAIFTGELNRTVVSLIKRQDNIALVDTRGVAFTRFTSGGDWENLRLIGIPSFDDMQLDLVELDSGRLPGRGEIAVDASTRDLTALDLGDTLAVRISPADEPQYLTLVGFTRSPATLGAGLLNQATAYVDAPTFATVSGQSAANFLLVRVSDGNVAGQSAGDITRLLSKRDIATGTVNVRDPDEFVGSRELGTLLLLLQVFSYLGAILASVIVANTLAAVMAEETAQIGIIKSMGGRARHILLTYLLYAAVLGFAGAAIGWGVGVVAGRRIGAYLAELTGHQQPPLVLAWRDVLLALLVGAVVTILSALLPAFSGSRARVASLLRAPGIRAEFRRPTMSRITAPLTRASSTAAVGARNLLRRPARSFSTILVVVVAVAAFVATQALSRSVGGTVDDLYALYGADGWAYFEGGADVRFARELERNPWVLEAEPWTSASGSIGSRRTDIWGMPANDPLYDYQLIEGSWVSQSNPPSAVLTSNLAGAIEAQVGDVLVLDVGATAQPIRIAGIVDDSSTYLGNTSTGKVFMDVRDVNRLRGLGTSADIFAFRFTSSDPDDVDLAMRSIEDQTRDLGPVTFPAYSDQQSARRAIGILTLMLNAMVVVVAVVGIAGIANTLLINIAERRREFGIMRALGGRTRHTVAVLVTEGVSLALIGLLVGTAAGYPLARLLVDLTGERLFELNFYFSVQSLALTFFVALMVVSAVSTIPGVIASRIDPIHALRYE